MQASDRELLELAAKAAGLIVIGRFAPVSIHVASDGCKGGVHWNPLTDDGDALRLAVKLRFVVGQHLGAAHAGVPPCPDDYEDGKYPVRIAEMLNADPYAATRRAVVRAAAEIGRSME
jgi:hypothetical protein